MKGSRATRLGVLVVAALLLVALVSAGAMADKGLRHDDLGQGHGPHGPSQTWAHDLGLDWYDVTDQTVHAGKFPEPVIQSRTWAVSWLAAARAVDDSDNRSYATAAFAQALHDTLAAQVPSQQAQLDSELAATLATVPDGGPKSAGIEAGQEQAAEVLAARSGDGLDTASVDRPYTPPPPGPGVWEPVPPAFAPAIRAGQGDARSFLLKRNDQFDPGPPPSLKSKTYRRDLNEVRVWGAATGSPRSDEQTEIALFWYPALNDIYGQALRQSLDDTQHSLAWQTRFIAAFHVVTTDAQIAIYNAKYEYVAWRPVTAIRNDAIDPDPIWTPLSVAPAHPEYPSGHGGQTGSSEAVLEAFLGPRTPAPITLTSTGDPGVTRTFTRWSQISDEIIDARVWEGVHFRFSDNIGDRLGYEVARYDLGRLSKIGL